MAKKSNLRSALEDAAGAPTVRAVAASAVVAAGGLAVGKLAKDRAQARTERIDSRSYELDAGESVDDGIRRIARGQIDVAIESLEGSDDPARGIHEARKALKRSRAVVRLTRDVLGVETYREENAILRDTGRRLSAIRDAQVMRETLADLEERYREEIPEGRFNSLRRVLDQEAGAARERARSDPELVPDVLRTLSAARARIALWPLEPDLELSALTPGFKRIAKRGRRAIRRARRSQTTEHFHELRKRAKDMWHASQILRPAAPKKLRKLARRSHRLANLTGDDHDLAVLLDHASGLTVIEPAELELLAALIGRRREQLQKDALVRGRRIYARRPRRLARLIASSLSP